MGQLIRCLTDDGTVMAMVLDSTDIVARAEQIHKTSAVVTAALGRTLTTASMMGMMLKNRDDSVTLRIAGDGPIGTITAVSDSQGNVRGMVTHPIVEIPLKPNGKLDVSGAVGKGMLYVIRDLYLDGKAKEPYVGCTPLISGEIAEDITYYYATSEQTPTVCALGVLVNPDLTVRAAGGLLIQLLPACPETVITRLEQNIANLEPMTTMLEKGLTLRQICEKALDGFSFNVLDTAQPVYRCTCSRERIERALATLSEKELRELPNQDGTIEVTCSFCDQVYHYSAEELERLITK